jgi:hypothetical protein
MEILTIHTEDGIHKEDKGRDNKVTIITILLHNNHQWHWPQHGVSSSNSIHQCFNQSIHIKFEINKYIIMIDHQLPKRFGFSNTGGKKNVL